MTQEVLILKFETDACRDVTHAKVIVVPDQSVEVTFGKLNRAGHYHPIRSLKKSVWPTPGIARRVHDGAGWDLDVVREFMRPAEIAVRIGLAEGMKS